MSYVIQSRDVRELLVRTKKVNSMILTKRDGCGISTNWALYIIWKRYGYDSKTVNNVLYEGNDIEHLDVNFQDDVENTILMSACEWRRSKHMKFFLSIKDIDVNLQDDVGNTALIIASGKDYKECVKLLLTHKDIDVNLQNKDGDTALILTLPHEYYECVELLENR